MGSPSPRVDVFVGEAAAIPHGMPGGLRAVWEHAADAMALSDPEGIVLLANPAYHRLYGYTPDQVLGRSFAVIFPEEERTNVEAQYQAIFAAEDLVPAYESVVRRADGIERVVEARYTFLERDGRREAMLSIVRDISERKALEAHLREAVAAREQLMVTAAHELRNPLTVLKGYAQVVARQLPGAPRGSVGSCGDVVAFRACDDGAGGRTG